MQLHRPLNRPGLIVLLERWAMGDSEPVPHDTAVQWSQWLTAIDAIRLSGALSAIESAPALAACGPPAAERERGLSALEVLFDKATAEMSGLMAVKNAPNKPSRGRADSAPADSAPAQSVGSVESVDFGAHGQRYLGLQKQMSARLAALRAQMRERLSGASPAFQQLAALDAAMEQVVSAHEQRLWASLPLWLEKRHAQLLKSHAQRLEAALAHDAPHDARLDASQAGGWLVAFEQDMRALLLAEMQARLAPHRGLLEAARNDDR